jgi:hypothetical protein
LYASIMTQLMMLILIFLLPLLRGLGLMEFMTGH